jgi:hypothetical protein
LNREAWPSWSDWMECVIAQCRADGVYGGQRGVRHESCLGSDVDIYSVVAKTYI